MSASKGSVFNNRSERLEMLAGSEKWPGSTRVAVSGGPPISARAASKGPRSSGSNRPPGSKQLEIRPFPATRIAPLPAPYHGLPPREALRWALQAFRTRRLALVSAFGPGSMVLIHLLAEAGARVPVIFIDTLHHFPETLEHVERVRTHYGLDLRISRPAPTRQTFEARYGSRLWQADPDRYQWVAKIEPFRRATGNLEACITGRRRDQAATRLALEVVQPGVPIRINPLATWTATEVWRFIREYDLPYNPLHDRGYASIGDAPLTTPVAAGEHERAGRWRGLGRLECGIHTFHHS